MTAIFSSSIKDEREYDVVLKRIDQIFDAKPGTPEGNELEILLLMVDTYQKRIDLLPDVGPVEVIKFILQQQGLTLSDIVHFLGGEEMANEIMSGKKSLDPQMINVLSINLHIPVKALV